MFVKEGLKGSAAALKIVADHRKELSSEERVSPKTSSF